ncbi:PEP-CTERM sorting domain-containing protein [Herbaspirillum sp. LeCh32-8]|uniref:FxDxF family PEP-CTERM protein n=1 Tax=Herbaspirillum sp. LeCh32-8 TaxID=2821356 RepID=UPI001AEB578A|nr:FxDxF family PEP-CTERM protein [Herbaspirillum sp. LeCh32-8]MBP0596614.1 PEP-CTERM sorting domain-containing protein [Herbaspirillum sp. LeCh32-8]
MKKLIGSLLLASALVAIGSTASAADLERTRTLVWTDSTSTFNARYGDGTTGLSFLENFNFSVDGSSSVSSAVVSIALDGLSRLGIDSFTLTGNGQTYTGTSLLNGDTQTFSLRTNGLSAGLYTLSVAGTILGSGGGSFAGNISVAPVPEASTTAMMLGGLGLVGFAAYRRRRNGGKSESQQHNQLMPA